MKIAQIALTIVLSIASVPVLAASAADNLSSCFADNTTGKERKELARWVFIAMATHPEIQDISKITPTVREATNKNIGALVTKLMTETCVTQARFASKEGGDAIKNAFEVLGKLAMQELMSDAGVRRTTQEFARYLDSKKFEAALQPQ